MYESNEAAQIKTVKGWVSSTGRFWGKDENMARYEGSTHKLCDCGGVMKKGYTKCEACQARAHLGAYFKMPEVPFDKAGFPVYDDVSEEYFFDEDSIEEYLEEHDKKPEDLKLYICDANNPSEIDTEFWDDILPEDGDIPSAVQIALDALNKTLRESKPWSWSPGNKRTTYQPI